MRSVEANEISGVLEDDTTLGYGVVGVVAGGTVVQFEKHHRLDVYRDAIDEDRELRPSAVLPFVRLRRRIPLLVEPDPDGSGRLRIRHGVAEDRRISIEDKDMRHG